jgi:hypothetical protein
LGPVAAYAMVRRRMTYGRYLMYLEYIKWLPPATRVIARDWVNHALIGAIERLISAKSGPSRMSVMRSCIHAPSRSIFVLGALLTLVGLIMIPVPGPAAPCGHADSRLCWRCSGKEVCRLHA